MVSTFEISLIWGENETMVWIKSLLFAAESVAERKSSFEHNRRLFKLCDKPSSAHQKICSGLDGTVSNNLVETVVCHEQQLTSVLGRSGPFADVMLSSDCKKNHFVCWVARVPDSEFPISSVWASCCICVMQNHVYSEHSANLCVALLCCGFYRSWWPMQPPVKLSRGHREH